MATNMFLQGGAAVLSGGVGNGPMTSCSLIKLALTRGAGVASQGSNTVTGLSTSLPTDGTYAGGGTVTQSSTATSGFTSTSLGDGQVWISNPINQVTISAAPTANIRALESNAMANYGCGVYIFRWNGADLTVIATGVNTTELGTTEAARAITTTLVATTVIEQGARLVVVPVWVSAGGTSASSFTSSLFIAGTSSGASGDTFVTFTETITEATRVPVSAGVNFQDPAVFSVPVRWFRKVRRAGNVYLPDTWLPRPELAIP